MRRTFSSKWESFGRVILHGLNFYWVQKFGWKLYLVLRKNKMMSCKAGNMPLCIFELWFFNNDLWNSISWYHDSNKEEMTAIFGKIELFKLVRTCHFFLFKNLDKIWQWNWTFCCGYQSKRRKILFISSSIIFLFTIRGTKNTISI